MTIQQASQQLLFQLYHIYDEREAKNIADLVMEHITEWKKIDRVMNKQVPLSKPKEELLNDIIRQLLDYKPVQYILKEAWFGDMPLFVNEHVLIPRPETEELVKWVTEDLKPEQNNKLLLDVGTGSGCIAVTLKRKMPETRVFACDISNEALQVAKMNAAAFQASLDFYQCDFLNAEERNQLPDVDVIVSNPPYIPVNEKDSMIKQVIEYEPHVALFVNDNDPLIFYEAIAAFARRKLKAGGKIYVEIHEDLEPAVKQLFLKNRFAEVDSRKDLQGKYRMMRAAGLKM
jgi:release factor glutamine methyltransferase